MDKTEKQKLFNIFFATAFGIAVGFILIKECFAPMSAWLCLAGGAIAGFCAYILNDLRSALAAIPKAWKMTASAMPIIANALRQVLSFVFKKQINSWNNFAWSIFFTTNVYSYISALLIAVLLGRNAPAESLYIFLLVFPIIVSFSSCFLVLTMSTYELTSEDKKVILLSFPPILIGLMLYVIARWISIAVKKTILAVPKISLFFALFIVNLFRLIHSTDRLICGVDAFIFAMLAYGVGALGDSWVAGSVLVHLAIFSIAGGIFGVLNKLFIKSAVDSLANWLQNRVRA